jgi:hypothetical protein
MPVVRRQGCLRSYFFDHTDELMANRAFESGVAARDF